MMILILTLVVFALAMLFMAVGVLVRGRSSLRGSCGGPKPVGPDSEPLACDQCTCQSNTEIQQDRPTQKTNITYG